MTPEPAPTVQELLAFYLEAGVDCALAEEPVDGVERGQAGILFAPAPAEHFNRHGQMSLSLFQNPLLLFGSEGAGPAFVDAYFWGEGGEAAFSPGHEISYVKMVGTDLNADIRVRRKSGNLFQQFVSPHLE